MNLISSLVLFATLAFSQGQRITTIQLDGVQYFISRMNPYSPELNFFLAYQYCRSLGLQLASFETKEKADSIAQYLTNAGFNKFDFWISGNKLGTDMYLWMSTGLPFNATFNYMRKNGNDILTGSPAYDIPMGSTSPQRTARESGNAGLANSCVAMKAPTFEWDTDDCTTIKDFICEQTRCYYYNYGSIPVSTAQGKLSTTTTTTTIGPYTSSSYSKQQQVGSFVPYGLNELINKLKSSPSTSGSDDVNSPKPAAAPPSAAAVSSSSSSSSSSSDDGEDEVNLEHVTNGPYDTLHSNVEMQDDPVAMGEHHSLYSLEKEDYVSTIEPEGVTWFARSSDSNPSNY